MHDRLFAASGLDEPALQAAAEGAGLDPVVFNSCRDTGQPAQIVEADRLEAERSQIRGTPTFYFGKVLPDGRVQVSLALAGSRPMDKFKAILDDLLK
jgi:predicted DsbA family dithiol-disulfide isomerase